MTTSKINEAASELTEKFLSQIHSDIARQVQADIAQKLAQVDVKQIIRGYVDYTLKSMITEVKFPDSSIPGNALNFDKFLLNGNNIEGGIIKKFGSTGIQDNATQCQVTILDEATVVENKLITRTAEIKGNLIVDGDLVLRGEIPTDSPFYRDLVEHSAGLLKLSMDGQFFLQYADKVFDQIKLNGIDLSKVTMDGKIILEGNKLGYHVTDTNIQRVGELKSLTVSGELTASGSLSARNKRVGINTEEPAAALSIWDEECEVLIRKLRKDVAIIGSTRNQRVVLSSNNKNNIVLETDGSVSISQLSVGAVSLNSAESCPKTDAERGSVVFNEKPELGGPVGWVSLGGSRWANFGIIG